ncbi:MAG: S-methyl-5'-thioadenosine phosphorylase [Burkholderiaceae bacterium]
MTIHIGIIGGSGLDNPELFLNPKDEIVATRWGAPSSPLKLGQIAGIDVALLGRHGREHTIPPTQVNYRANIQALKEIGCSHILATTAVGSLREEICRGDLVIIDQFIDFTKQRKMTFHESFKPHEPVHTPMADPFDSRLRGILNQVCIDQGLSFHQSGTVVTIEGPRFSTRAESRMFRSIGADIINMSVSTEVALANEIGIPYAAIAMSTDYDCWKEDEMPVSWEAILRVFKSNADKVTKLLLAAIPIIAKQ